jgi:hypothetical protein
MKRNLEAGAGDLVGVSIGIKVNVRAIKLPVPGSHIHLIPIDTPTEPNELVSLQAA